MVTIISAAMECMQSMWLNFFDSISIILLLYGGQRRFLGHEKFDSGWDCQLETVDIADDIYFRNDTSLLASDLCKNKHMCNSLDGAKNVWFYTNEWIP